VTIDVLTDNTLLGAFEFYLGKDDTDQFDPSYNYDGWKTLVHVCRRWRCIVFASPRRLDLNFWCTTQRSVDSKTLDTWPALPIVIHVPAMKSKGNVTNIIGALSHHNRVRKIWYCNERFQDSLLKEFAAIDEPFPALTFLLLSYSGQNVPFLLPDSFLGGSAPRLRSLYLYGIPYPSIGKLLSSTTNLVRLLLDRIPHSGYIVPETIIPCLSTLLGLESLVLRFQHPRSRVHRGSRHPPPLTRVVLPSLTFFQFRGDIEYLEDILSQIETFSLNRCQFWLFNQLVFDTPLLGHFIRRTETFMTAHTARVEFSSWAVEVILLGREEMPNNERKALRFKITCDPLDWQISAVAQVLNSSLYSLPTLESLEVAIDHEDWQGEIEVVQWREFLHPFTFVKKMTMVREGSIQLVSPALQELAGERATEVLPALQDLFFRTYGGQPSGPVKEAIERLIAIRQLDGHPVTVHYEDTESEAYV